MIIKSTRCRRLLALSAVLSALLQGCGGTEDAAGAAETIGTLTGSTGNQPLSDTGGTLTGDVAAGTGGAGGAAGSGLYATLIFSTNSLTTFVNRLMFAGNGSNVTFVSNDNGLLTNPDLEEQIFNLELTGNTLIQVTNEPASNRNAFSNYDITDNGDQIVFTTTDDITGDNPTGSGNVFLAQADGSTTIQLTRNTVGVNLVSWVTNPQITADASRVFFISNIDLDTGKNPSGTSQIFSINADGTGLTQITNGDYAPREIALADGGSRIAFEGTGNPFGANADFSAEIFVINPDGAGDAQLTLGDRGSFSPRISDDGSLIVFTSRDDHVAGGNTDTSLEVFVTRGDGTGITQITSSAKDSGKFGGSSGTGSYDISGNGSYVVFNSLADLTGDNPDAWNALFWAGSDGSSVTQQLRADTVPGGVLSREGIGPRFNNDGSAMIFEGTANFDPNAADVGEKIFRMSRR